MKRLLYLFIMFLMPINALAQNVGGEIKRPLKADNRTSTPPRRIVNNKPISNNAKENSIKDYEETNKRELNPILQNLINNMVFVEGKTFTMGSASNQSAFVPKEELPLHQVELSSFYIGKFEVTQEEWETVMGNNPSYFKGSKKPVETISWLDCQKFIRELNRLTGLTFRLPTEAEWEYAARGGNLSNNYKYSGGNTLEYVAWFTDNSSRMTHDVGDYLANELGLYDMTGNVWEWCNDYYDENYYSVSPHMDPTGPSSGTSKVYRGGSYNNDANNCRLTVRNCSAPIHSFYNVGFRLVLSNTNLDNNTNDFNTIADSSPVNSSDIQVNSSEKFYYHPSVLLNADKSLSLESVILKTDRTVLVFSFKNDSGSAGISIDKNAYIMVNFEKYNLIRAQGIAYAPNHTNLSYKGETKSFELHFMPIPMDTSKIDFVENNDSSWKMYSISLK